MGRRIDGLKRARLNPVGFPRQECRISEVEYLIGILVHPLETFSIKAVFDRVKEDIDSLMAAEFERELKGGVKVAIGPPRLWDYRQVTGISRNST